MLCQTRRFHLFFFVEHDANTMIANKIAKTLNILYDLSLISFFA